MKRHHDERNGEPGDDRDHVLSHDGLEGLHRVPPDGRGQVDQRPGEERSKKQRAARIAVGREMNAGPDQSAVQHRMRENAKELFSWLEAGAHVYVCGDASRMAKDVDAALHEVIQTVASLTMEKAAEYVANLKTQNRYLRDVY